MPDVFNSQLGRNMHYPHAEAHPERQFAFVFNINRCIACQTCTMACKSTSTFSKGQEYMWWNNVETKPFGGYPQSRDVKLLKMLDGAHQEAGKASAWAAGDGTDPAAPYGTYDGMTIFEAAHQAPQREEVALGYEPSDQEWSSPDFCEDTASGAKDNREKLTMESATLPEHGTWFFYLQRCATTAPIRPASRPARAARSTSGPRTASC